MIDRRQFLLAGTASVAGLASGGLRAAHLPATAPMAVNTDGLALTVQPGRVYLRTADQNRLRQEAWLFNLVVMSTQARKPVIESLVVTALAGGQARRVTTWPVDVVAGADLVPAVAALPPRERYPVAAFQVAESLPAVLAIDAARCELSCRGAQGLFTLQRIVRIERYEQKVRLVFPFEGRGMITQGGAWNDGHRNRSGMFAMDAIGLTAQYAAMVGDGDAPEAVAGWGRDILAPAAGQVVIAIGDRPDQPVTGVSDPKYFAPQFPQGGDPGNHVVIDHGDGEFSMLAHMQQASLRVAVGDRVAQGQPIGRLGNSGDTSSPHVHHQLQDGPQWMQADALPHRYLNGPMAQHDRGTFFHAERLAGS